MTFCEWLATGSPPTYIAVVVAAVAAVFAYRSSRASRESADAASKQLKRLEEEREREQAKAVAIWTQTSRPLSSYDKVSGGSPVFFEYSNIYTIFYQLRNLSTMPIYDAFVYAETGSGLYQVAHALLVPPNTAEKSSMQSNFARPPAKEDDDTASRIGLLFRDAQGFCWDRQLNGKLMRMTDDADSEKRAEITKRNALINIEPTLRDRDKSDMYQIG